MGSPHASAAPFLFGSEPMDVTVLGLFLLASFIGGVTTGLAGFALALVVSGIWLHIISPTQTVTLIVASPCDAELRHLEVTARARLAEGGPIHSRWLRRRADR